MMQLYCQVQNNAITQGPMALPFASDNITGLNVAPDPTIYGWYSYSDPGEPTYDSNTQTLVRSFSINNVSKTVTRAYTAQALPPPTQAQLLNYAEQKALTVRNGGITISGIPVATNTSGIALLTGAHDYVAANPSAIVTFVVSQTVAVSLNADQINGMWFAVSGFIQSCYAVEASNNSSINAGTMTDTTEIDSALEQIQITF